VAVPNPEVRSSGRVQNDFFTPPGHSLPSKELRFIHPPFSKVALMTTTTTTTITTTTTTITTPTVITLNYKMQKRETNSKIRICYILVM
jgi:hypothetical protein